MQNSQISTFGIFVLFHIGTLDARSSQARYNLPITHSLRERLAEDGLAYLLASMPVALLLC